MTGKEFYKLLNEHARLRDNIEKKPRRDYSFEKYLLKKLTNEHSNCKSSK
jgi:hypothetical protein